MNLSLLHRVLSVPWALRRETLVAFTQALLAGQPLRKEAGSSFGVFRDYQGENDDGEVVIKGQRMATTAGYTAYSMEGLFADLRGTLPPVPAGTHVHLIWGTVGRGWTQMDRWWFDPVEVDEIITGLAARPREEKQVLWFRSPGGICTGIAETAQQIAALRAEGRRITAFSDDLCASAAYWLASQCDRIDGTPSAAFGSIGVYLAFYDFTEYLKQNGVKLELFKAGDLKAIGLPGNPLDDKAREYLMAGVLDAYAQFTAAVNSMRTVAKENMQGQTLDGKEALAANLVDDNRHPSTAAYLQTL